MEGWIEENMKIQSAFNHIRGEHQQSQRCWSKMQAYRFDGNGALVRIGTNRNIPLHSPWMDPLWLHPHATMKNVSNGTTKRRLIYINFLCCHFFAFRSPEKKKKYRCFAPRWCAIVEPINNGPLGNGISEYRHTLWLAIFHCHNLLWFMKTSLQCH